jgi:signal transduction histidine kinase
VTDPRMRHGRRRPSLRAQVLAVALVPSLLLMGAGLAVSTFLIMNADGAQARATALADALDGTSALLPAVDKERALSLLAVSGDRSGDLGAARRTVDAAYAALRPRLDALDRAGGSEELAKDDAALRTAVDDLVRLRRSIDAGQLDRLAVTNSLDTVQDAALELVAAAGPRSTGEEATQSRSDAEVLLRAGDQLARATALAAAAYRSGGLTAAEQTWFAQQMGVYDSELDQLGDTRLDGDGDTKLAAVRQSKARTTIEELEDAVVAARPDAPSPPRATTVDIAAYSGAAGETVSALTAIGVGELAFAAQKDAALTAAARHQALAVAGLLVVLAVIVLVAAFRVANGLVRRLAALRDGTLRRAREELPALVEQLRAGTTAGSTALTPLDGGDDEIGQVASAFELAQQTAVDAAAAEAAARAGFGAVFLNIAHRSQGIVHRQLRMIDEAERAESDPDQLARLFRLDHLATRERRNAENLLILGGGQPGRQWREPVSLVDVVRSAVSETVQYDRVTVGRMPPLGIIGGGVADLVHLLAELLDNAISFSPPDAHIEVRANTVGRGLIIEIEDQGLGLELEQREQLNGMLAEPVDFEVLDLSDDPRFGLFVVARLAHRQDIRVTLLESAFGGVRAVVLVPAALLVARSEAPAPGATTPAAPSPLPSARTPAAAAPAGDGAAANGRARGGSAVVTIAGPPQATAVLAGDRPDPDRPRLPRRRRQDALAPQLADAPTPDPDEAARPDEDTAHTTDDAGAERSRSVLGDLQRRTRAARVEEEESDAGE